MVVDLRIDKPKFMVFGEISLRATAKAAEPLLLILDVERPRVSDIAIHVTSKSLRAEVVRIIGGLDAEIKRFIADGKTKKQVLAAMVDEYGRGILADPPTSGFDITTWLVPAGVVAALLAALALLIPRWRRSDGTPAEPEDAPGLSPASARKLDEDLARYKA
jgi:hypothetical protein